MNAASLLQSLAPMPLFAVRPFIPAFLIALAARFGDGVLPTPIQAPPWFVHDVALWVLGALALADFASRHNVDLRAVMEEVDTWLKGGTAAVVHLGLVDPQSAALLQTFAAAGPGFAYGVSALVAGGVWGVATLRRGTLLVLQEIDEDDDLGLQGLIAWAEDLGVVGGVALALLLPVVALVLFGLTIFALWLLRLALRELEERSKVPCAACGQPLHPSALACPHCGTENREVRAAGVFGRSAARPAPQPARHRLRLLAWRRCPRCATRLPRRTVRQPCPACGRVVFRDGAELEAYLASVRARLPRTMGVCFLFGLVPLAGLVVGIVYYRVGILSGLRGYVPRHAGCLTRWGVRAVNIVLIALQPIPVLGAFTLPLMCWTNHTVWERTLRGQGVAPGG